MYWEKVNVNWGWFAFFALCIPTHTVTDDVFREGQCQLRMICLLCPLHSNTYSHRWCIQIRSMSTEDDLPSLSIPGQSMNDLLTMDPDFANMSFAPVPKKRGRPKGNHTTAIGLPRSKKAKLTSRAIPFHKKDTTTKGYCWISLWMTQT